MQRLSKKLKLRALSNIKTQPSQLELPVLRPDRFERTPPCHDSTRSATSQIRDEKQAGLAVTPHRQPLTKF